MANNISNVGFSDYSSEQQEIDRRRKMAEALQAQSMQPIETQTAGGYAIPISWTQGLAKALQAYSGMKGMESAKEQQKALGNRRSQALAEALAGGPPKATTTELPGSVADQGQFGMAPQTQTTPPNYGEYLGRLAAIGPDAVSIGTSLIGAEQRTQEGEANREAKKLDRIMTLDAAAENAALSREERAARAAEAAQLRREMMTAQQQFQASQAAQAAEDRRALAAQSAAERRSLAAQASADRAANRPVQPLVQVMGPNGQPTWVERQDAIGKTPAGAGSKAEATIAGKADVDKDVMTLKSTIDELKAGGGMTDPSQSSFANIGARIGASGIGQTVGSFAGTKNQTLRDKMNMIRPSLLRSIMQSTGMSAKQMDSNAELKLWLSTATDPTVSYEANMEALNNIASKYGGGGFLQNGRTSAGKITQPSGPKFLGFE